MAKTQTKTRVQSSAAPAAEVGRRRAARPRAQTKNAEDGGRGGDRPAPVQGAVVEIAIDRLKASPRNARKTPHSPEFVAQLAASIAAKGLLQAPVVEPERDASGEPTGFWLVTIGEGRRQALALLAGRGEIDASAAVACLVDEASDAQEISLDENITREAMHPADQFEAFRDLAERRGWSAEEIGARFGVTAQVVRQRLRLAAVAPDLMAAYRAGDLNLDQLMALALTEDHDRQRAVLERLPAWNRHPGTIRRLITESQAPASDRRAAFVGLEAYTAAGGTVLRDLFTEDDGGWLEDVGLLDRLAQEKLAAEAEAVRAAEGWAWAEARLDYPHGHGLGRIYPAQVARSEDEAARMAALRQEQETLAAPWEAVEDLPPEVAARLDEIEAELESFGDDWAYAAEDRARAGLFAVLTYEGTVRIERGLVRPEDARPAPAAGPDGAQTPERDDGTGAPAPVEGEAPLSERLALDLSAHRTVGLRDALAGRPDLALTCVVHVLALRSFYPPYEVASPLDIKAGQPFLGGHAPGLDETPAGRRIAERHEAWARRMPEAAEGAFAFVAGLDAEERLALLAHCASLTLSAVRGAAERPSPVSRLTDRLAALAGLDMAAEWTPTVTSYLGRVTKGRVLEAVREARGEGAMARIAGMKKAEMAAEAEALLADSGWLPTCLRTSADACEPQEEGVATEADQTVDPSVPGAE